MYSHECTKCKQSYRDDDPEAYLCASCIAMKNEIARQVDAQFANRPKVEPMSDLKLHEMNGKVVEIDGRKVIFARA